MKRFPPPSPLSLPLEKIAQEIAVAIILENFKTINKTISYNFIKFKFA